MLNRKTKSLKDIVRNLQVYRDNVDEEERTSTTNAGNELENAHSQKEILQHLIDFLDSC
jgi:beta-catenin-like protein 1